MGVSSGARALLTRGMLLALGLFLALEIVGAAGEKQHTTKAEETEKQGPELVSKEEGVKLWYKYNGDVSKVVVKVILRTDYRLGGIKNEAAAEMFCGVAESILKDQPAEYEGFEFKFERVYSPANGIITTISGKGERMGEIVEKALRKVKEAEIGEDAMKMAKERYRQALDSWEQTGVGNKAEYYIRACLTKGAYIPGEIQEQVDHIGMEDVKECRRHFLNESVLEILIYGNIKKKEATEIKERAQKVVGGKGIKRKGAEKKTESIKIARNKETMFYRVVPGGKTTALYCIQLQGMNDREGAAKLILFHELVKYSLVDMQEQDGLGKRYLDIPPTYHPYTMIYGVEGSEKGAKDVMINIRNAIDQITEEMKSLREGKLKATKEGLVNMEAAKKQELATTIQQQIATMRQTWEGMNMDPVTIEAIIASMDIASMETLRINAEIGPILIDMMNGTYDFEGQEIVMDVLKGLTKEGILRYCEENIKEGKRRGVWIALMGEENKEELEQLKREEGLELVEINAKSVKAWQDRQKEVYEAPYSFVEVEK